MNNKIKTLLLINLLSLNIYGCKNNNKHNTNENSTNQISNSSSYIDDFMSNVKINDFIFVYPSDGSNDLYNSIFDLNTEIKKQAGNRLEIERNTENYLKNDFEIIVGNINRDDIKEYYKDLKNDEIIIKFVNNKENAKLIIGGIDDTHSIYAINEFYKLFTSYEIMDPTTKYIFNRIDYKINLSKIYLTNDELKEYKILYNENSDEIVTKAIEHLRNDFSKALGVKLDLIACNNSTDISKINKAICIGNVSNDSEKYAAGLATNSFNIQARYLSNNSRIYITGTSQQEILNGLQYVYKNSVINGELKFKKYLTNTTTSLIRRDPCIVPYDNKYYLYTATDTGYAVMESEDLLNWSNYKVIFDQNDNSSFNGYADYWAPECHYYNGEFYLFVTYRSKVNNHRGCSIMKSSTPNGKFIEITNGHITPSDWDAIDGTLYINPNGIPYMVFVHEWTSMEDGIGAMCYARLSDDFTTFMTEPKQIFRASDPSWTDQSVTDGPYLHRLQNGTLLMIWSNFADTDFSGYTIGISKSSNGDINGTWEHYNEPLFWDDKGNIYEVTNGGHGMIFKGYDNRLYLTLHGPNSNDESNLYFTKFMYVPLVEDYNNNTLKLDLIY